jgi:methionyl-tRNA formyltransferase
MKEIGAQLLAKTVKGLADGSLKETPQESVGSRQLAVGSLKHAPKIFTETCKINWQKTVDEVYNLIRGLSPYPAAFTELERKTLKIFHAKKEKLQPQTTVGSFETDKKTFLKFACADGYIQVRELQLEGKKKMLVEDFLRGYRFAS